ncbi:L-2-hydroxyglutarate oxidase [Chloroflexia bacterium SDU3-3]|nr:L-2-hydroxyglutarate oxidase [Chloroflexia bacterium SDU3-3]
MYDYVIIGGGIVGLATARELAERMPGARVLVLEKEQRWAAHQTGNNSGVIHSGIYYKPGSYKARFARAGSQSMVAFCQQHGIAHEVCGKIIVATEPEELPLLEKLYQRGLENQLDVRRVGPDEIREREPHVRALAGILVASTGIVSYTQVAQAYARLVRERGGALELGARVERMVERPDGTTLETTAGTFMGRFIINCAGLHSDRVAAMGGAKTGMQIVPFRGEYYELVPERRHLVRHLIYPVPNPNFPFLGVHFTRMIDGSVHAGPNAVLGLKREAYRKRDFSLRDSAEVLLSPAFWRLAAKNMDEGVREMWRSFNKAAFVASMRRMIPEIGMGDVVPAHAGVRAQALLHDGALVDDFHLVQTRSALHVCNAPSPAATASIEIGRAIADRLAPIGAADRASERIRA